MLRLNLGVPVDRAARTGSACSPATCRASRTAAGSTDDVVDIALQALEGAAQTGKLVDALAAGDKVDANDNAFGDTFPYVALPNNNAVNTAENTRVRPPRRCRSWAGGTGPADGLGRHRPGRCRPAGRRWPDDRPSSRDDLRGHRRCVGRSSVTTVR